MALCGFGKTLAVEGEKHRVKCNIVAPMAASKLTENILPKEVLKILTVEKVAPFVAYLCHDSCTENGSVFEIAGGYASKLRWERSEGLYTPTGDLECAYSTIVGQHAKIFDYSQCHHPNSMYDIDWVAKAKHSASLKCTTFSKGNSELRNQVIIVTGSASGLGKAYALFLASLGAKIVAVDLDSKNLEKVVGQISKNGGQAVAFQGNILKPSPIIAFALESYGTIHCLINNAGILRDKSFKNMTEDQWNIVLDVHLKGTFSMCKAVWPQFVKQKYGRIINTSSAVGLYGNFGQANYSSAKAGIIGISKTLALEGKKSNIHVNVIAPNAGTPMTENIFGADVARMLKPEFISPFVAFLSGPSCSYNGQVIEVGSGWAAGVRIQATRGLLVSDLKLASIQSKWKQIVDFDSGSKRPESADAIVRTLMSMPAKETARQSNEASLVVSSKFKYTLKDVILYNIGIGFKHDEPRYTYENAPLEMFPTFLILPPFVSLMSMNFGKYLVDFSLAKLLHAEQFLQIFSLPESKAGALTTSTRVVETIKKQSGTILTFRSISKVDDNVISISETRTFHRSSSPALDIKGPVEIEKYKFIPNLKPDFEFSEQIPTDQALLYRLSGDLNPLHM